MIALRTLSTDSKFSKCFIDCAVNFISTNTTIVDGCKEVSSVKAASSVSHYAP